MEKGIFPSLYGGLFASSLMTEFSGIAMLLPFLNDRKKVKNIFVLSNTIIIIFYFLITFCVLSILGSEVTKRHTFPFLSTVRLVSVGDFIERVESVQFGIWILDMFVKVSFYYYLTILGIAQLLNLKDYKPLILPVATIIVPLTLMTAENITEVSKFLSYRIFTWYSLFFVLLIPLFLLLTAVITKKRIN